MADPPAEILKRAPDPKIAAKAKETRIRKRLFWANCLVAVALLPVFFAVAAIVMIIDRDISAPSWLVREVEARAADALNGGEMLFGDIFVNIGRDLHPIIRLEGIQLKDANGVLIGRVPEASGTMSPRGLIFQRDVLMQHVTVTGPQINLQRAQSGAVAIAFGDGTPTRGRSESMPGMLEQIDIALERPVFEALETVNADGLVINFDDLRAGRSWTVDGGQIALDLRGGQTTLAGQFAVLSGRPEVTDVSLSYASTRGQRAADLSVTIDDALASDIATQSPGLRWLSEFDAPISASMRTSLDDDGRLGPLHATLALEAGALRPNPNAQPIRFDAAKTYLTYDPARDRIRFNELSVESEWGALQATGDAYLREFEDGLPQALLTQFALTDIRVNPDAVYDAPLEIASAEVDARVRFAPFSIELGQAILFDGPATIAASGKAQVSDAGWQVRLDAKVDDIAPEGVMAYWPTALKPRTRDWLVRNLNGGRISDGHIGLRIAPDAPLQFAAEFGFAGTEIRYMRTMPPITDAHGTASFIGNEMIISVDDATVTPPQGGAMQMAGSSFTIPELGAKPAQGVLDLRLQSSATAVMSLLNQEPFEFIDKANLPVTLVDGRAQSVADIQFPIAPRIPQNEISYDVTVDLAAARSTALLEGRTVASADLQITATQAGMDVEGPVLLDGVPADITWSRQFGPDAPAQSVLQGSMALTPAALDTFGINLPPGMVQGRGRADMTVTLARGAAPRLQLNSDLRGLTLSIPAIGWRKTPNANGSLQVAATLGAVPVVQDLALRGGGLRADGRVDLTAGGQLQAARFSQVQIGDWFDAPVTLTGRGAGRPLGITVGGGTLDLRRASFGGGGNGGGPLDLTLDRLQITENIALTDLTGDLSTNGGLSGDLRGRINGRAPVNLALSQRDGGTAVRLRSQNAGRVLRSAGIIRNVVGGDMDLRLIPTGAEGTFDGRLSMEQIRVRDAPAMAALLDAISVVGLLQQLDGQGLAFDDVDARFRITPSQLIVTESSAVGPGLGISADGIYTLASQQLDLQGVVSPFFLINGIGSFLTRRGEGLIGFNFNLRGTSDSPQVSVNPLSALTPGMFREIFRRPPPELSQ